MKPGPDIARIVRNRFGALVACGLLTSCAPLGPNYKRPEAPLPSTWRVELNEAAEVTNTQWWRAFGDEYLNQLIDQAMRANADLLIATARVEQFAAQLEITHSEFLPQLGYDVGYERVQRSEEVPELLNPGQPSNFSFYKGLLAVSYELDLWGRMRRSYEASRAQLLSTEQARHTVILTVVTSVASTYIELLAADRELNLAKQTLDSLKSSWELTERKFRGGSATDIQAGVAHADYENQIAVIPDIERKIAFLEDSLSVLLGRNPGPVQRGRLDELMLMNVPGGIPADVLMRRPDVLAAEQDLIAANARIGIAKAGYFPAFSLTSSFGQASNTTSTLLDETARTGNLAVGLLGSLFTFGRVEGDIRAAQAETREQEIRYLQTVRNALKEVNDALVAKERSRMKVAALNRRTSILQSVADITRMRFEGGSATDLDLQNAGRSVYAAQSDSTDAVREEFLALVSIFKAMGGGWMLGQDKALALIKPAGTLEVSPTATARVSTSTEKVTAP